MDAEGQYRILELSANRKFLREMTTVIRLVIAGFMTFQGTQYLIYTIAVEELLLNAVALAPRTTAPRTPSHSTHYRGDNSRP